MKRLGLILLSLVMAVGMAACGQNKNNNNTPDNGQSTSDSTPDDGKDPAAVATPAEIEQKIAEAIGADNYLCDTDIDRDWLQNSYQLDMSRVEDYVAKQSAIPSVNADVVIVLKVQDGYAADAVDALNTYYAQQVSYIRQYPFGTAKVLNGRIYQSGDCVIYVIAGANYDGDDADAEAKLAVGEYAKIDAVVKDVFGTLPENRAVVPEDSGSHGGLVIPDDSDEDDDMPALGG